MDVAKKIIDMIENISYRGVFDSKNSEDLYAKMDFDLYTDLGIDSLSFVSLLVDIENEFLIEFSLAEMSSCLRLSNLIALTNEKYQKKYKYAKE